MLPHLPRHCPQNTQPCSPYLCVRLIVHLDVSLFAYYAAFHNFVFCCLVFVAFALHSITLHFRGPLYFYSIVSSLAVWEYSLTARIPTLHATRKRTTRYPTSIYRSEQSLIFGDPIGFSITRTSKPWDDKCYFHCRSGKQSPGKLTIPSNPPIPPLFPPPIMLLNLD